jgi:uncharacterized tellurite resistance protein B-like protein
MDTHQEKLSLLQEMIAFALVDGELHDNEYDFIEVVAHELSIDKVALLELYKNKTAVQVIKDEFNRICQFYRLALLMQCDGILHEREQVKINEIGIRMGLNPFAMKRILHLMQTNKKGVIDGQTLLAIFSEQYN